ncbi:MAG: hypothetical protein J5989_01030 [Alistipes sp.]|nr:hypothetical protein [Alistipes sp.]
MKKFQIFTIVAALIFGVDAYAQQQGGANGQAPQQRSQAGFGGMRSQRGGMRQQMKPEDLAKQQTDIIADWIDMNDAQKQEVYNMYLATAKEQQTMYEEQMKLMQAIRQKQQALQAKQEEQLKAIVGDKKYEKYQKQKQAQMERMQQRMQQMRQAQQQGGSFGEQGGGQRSGGDDGGFGGNSEF